MTPLLKLSEINTAYSGSHILHDVSISVEEGEVVAILGRNGAGKTTTLRSIIGIQRPFLGTIRWDGVDITHEELYETAKRGVGYVPEERRLFSKLTVEEHLKMAAFVNDVDERDGLRQIYELFPPLEAYREREAENLSGGEQQMLAIGRSLIGKPEMLLLDEPTEGLAPQIITTIKETIEDLAKSKTIILVEQNYPVARALCDRYYLFDQGTVISSGTMVDLDDETELKEEYLGVSTSA